MSNTEISFHLEELIAAIVFLITGGGLGTIIAKQKGWITFGKPVERRDCRKALCDQHDLVNEKISNMESDVKEVKGILKTVNGKVDRLIGYHQGKNGIDLR